MLPEIRRWPAWRQIEAVAADAEASASALGARAAQAVADLAKQLAVVDPASGRDLVRAAVDMLAAQQPTVAPLASLRNETYLAGDGDAAELAEHINELADRQQARVAGVARVGAALIDPGASIMVHSSSSSVRAMLDRARTLAEFRVVCTEALPVGEGRLLAADLGAAGFSVELLSDEDAVAWVGGVDLVAFGADAIGPGRVINKVGTSDLARAAANHGVPAYLVAGLDKMLPEPLFEAALTAVDSDERIGGLSELVPLEWFHGVVTEEGVIRPDQLAQRAAALAVHPDLVTNGPA